MALTPLSHSRDSRFAGSDLDVRGWDVRTDLDDEKVGSVDDMLIDDSGRPRYLDVDLGLLRKHVLVPIGQARVDDRRDVVRLPDMTKDRFEHIPEWDRDMRSLDRAYEDRLSAAYRGADSSVRDDEDAREGTRRGTGELRELDDLDGYHIPKEELNPKGWTVVTADGREVGEVDELIVDTSAMMVRYLDCDLDRDELGFDTDRERHVLIPLQQVRLDREDKQVLVDGLTADSLRDLPVYGGLPIAGDFETRLQQAFGGGTGSRMSSGGPAGRMTGGESRYDDARFDDRRFYGDRLRGRSATSAEDTPSLRDREPMDDETQRLERADADERAARAELEARARQAEDRQSQADADERRMADDAQRAADASGRTAGDEERAAEAGTRMRPDEEVRIRVRGDEIIVEKRPKE